MNAQKFLAAAAMIAAAGSVFAGEPPVSESKLNVPVLAKTSARSRDDVRAEAIEAAKNAKTTLAAQLEQYKN
ncbi:hypothetical protein Q4S45_03095 [Massilia sp. R2A-15]|uniref:hypothetical protein n=1 Tax=Massilia sp. R2A-15 TaxID=3064278 RepID=UPI002734FDA3|nr:hypothetical protein [Massilia sp. R2A-15]WLI90124.1 hypothetical protein Q4S45_03095 [Massilia sp. R2A-15]